MPKYPSRLAFVGRAQPAGMDSDSIYRRCGLLQSSAQPTRGADQHSQPTTCTNGSLRIASVLRSLSISSSCMGTGLRASKPNDLGYWHCDTTCICKSPQPLCDAPCAGHFSVLPVGSRLLSPTHVLLSHTGNCLSHPRTLHNSANFDLILTGYIAVRAYRVVTRRPQIIWTRQASPSLASDRQDQCRVKKGLV